MRGNDITALTLAWANEGDAADRDDNLILFDTETNSRKQFYFEGQQDAVLTKFLYLLQHVNFTMNSSTFEKI